MRNRIIMFIAAICVVAMIVIAFYLQSTFFTDTYAAYVFAIPMSVVAIIMLQITFSKEGV